MDDDVAPCSGQGMADLFGLLKKHNVDYMGPQWRKYEGKFNHGVMILDRDRVQTWVDAWENIQDKAFGKCAGYRGDQATGNMAWQKVKGIKKKICPENICCGHYTPLPKCSQ